MTARGARPRDGNPQDLAALREALVNLVVRPLEQPTAEALQETILQAPLAREALSGPRELGGAS